MTDPRPLTELRAAIDATVSVVSNAARQTPAESTRIREAWDAVYAALPPADTAEAVAVIAGEAVCLTELVREAHLGQDRAWALVAAFGVLASAQRGGTA